GNEEHFNLSRPFYSLETRYAGGGSVDHVLTTDQVNNQGSQLTEYRSNYTQLDLFGGVKLNNSVVDIYRLTVHYNYTGTDYYSNAGTTAGTLPRDNALSGPVASGTLNQNHFIKETFVDKAERIEDINLGHSSVVSVGYSDRVLGATDNSVPFVLLDQFGFGGNG